MALPSTHPDSRASTPPATGPSTGEHVDLLVGGMTCASCVSRVERRLNRLPGVHAVVNLATASASESVSAEAAAAE